MLIQCQIQFSLLSSIHPLDRHFHLRPNVINLFKSHYDIKFFEKVTKNLQKHIEAFFYVVRSHQPWRDIFRCLSDALIPLYIEGRHKVWLYSLPVEIIVSWMTWHKIYNEIFANVSSPPNLKRSLYFQEEGS